MGIGTPEWHESQRRLLCKILNKWIERQIEDQPLSYCQYWDMQGLYKPVDPLEPTDAR